MKNRTLFIAVLLCTSTLFAQINPSSPWVWMKGDNTVDQYGIYGTAGVAHSLNKPGARNISATWRDVAGNLWLLGGMGLGKSNTGLLNDLWKFDPVTLKWTWMKGDDEPDKYSVYGIPGTASSANKPGGIYSGISWRDNTGNFWLFGGYGFSENNLGLLNTLWKYDISLNEWTWVNGGKIINMPGSYGTKGVSNNINKPGARYCSQSWTDSNGDLWLFGGFGYGATISSSGALNDLWKYSIVTNEWTWMNGDSIIESKAFYGTKNVTGSLNVPGGRYLSTSWKDRDGLVWIFGGYGFDENNLGFLNDLWKYDPVLNEWTWVSGNNITDQAGEYGVQGTASAVNKPGGRYTVSSWIDQTGDFWLFGGYGFDTAQTGYLNDLWKYHPPSGEWTWVKGDKIIDQPAVYGTQCQPDSSNKSGARMSSISWTDGIGNLWLFGGYGFDSNNSGSLNDLWRVNSNQFLLPVHLLSFTGVLNDDEVDLKWLTEEETNFSHYNIQRSFDGVLFSTCGNIKSAGNGAIYNWQDRELKNYSWQKVFYRLQIVNKTGQSSYSKVLLFDKKQVAVTIRVFPNPVSSTLNLSFVQKKKGKIQISITDMKGAMIRTQAENIAAGWVSLNIDVNTLPASAYIISVQAANFSAQQQFIKQ